MNMSSIYTERHLIPEKYEAEFLNDRKYDLNTVEMVGLEAVLCRFVEQHQDTEYGEISFTDMRGYTRWDSKAGRIDILDGCYDTYIFENYAIAEIWMTTSGCIMLTCYQLEETEEYDDPWDIVQNTDWQSDCKAVLFRLD